MRPLFNGTVEIVYRRIISFVVYDPDPSVFFRDLGWRVAPWKFSFATKCKILLTLAMASYKSNPSLNPISAILL